MSESDDILLPEGTPPPVPAEAATEEISQWEIVAKQFRKHRAAVFGLRRTIALILIAIYAPVIASGVPFVWTDAAGNTTYPWFSKLFDVNYWENPVDRFFNLLLVVVTAWFAFRFVLFLANRSREARQAIRSRARPFVIGVAAVAAVGQFLFTGFLTTSQPYQNYVLDRVAMDAAGTEYNAVWAMIPYGHREQLETQHDSYRPFMDFERGETHLFGTDEIGRDVFARLIYGTRISITVGLVAVSIYVLIGMILGALAGFYMGWVDIFIMRLVEIVICVPGLFLILTIIALFDKKSIFMIMLAIGLVGWTSIARLIRGEFIRERNRDYVSAAKSLGYSGPRILFRHILPNSLGPVIVAATFGVASAIIIESSLSFLGLGDSNVPSWGQILNDGRITQYWHMIIPPGVAIFITVTLLNLVGDGLRDALDPKLRA